MSTETYAQHATCNIVIYDRAITLKSVCDASTTRCPPLSAVNDRLKMVFTICSKSSRCDSLHATLTRANTDVKCQCSIASARITSSETHPNIHTCSSEIMFSRVEIQRRMIIARSTLAHALHLNGSTSSSSSCRHNRSDISHSRSHIAAVDANHN